MTSQKSGSFYGAAYARVTSFHLAKSGGQCLCMHLQCRRCCDDGDRPECPHCRENTLPPPPGPPPPTPTVTNAPTIPLREQKRRALQSQGQGTESGMEDREACLQQPPCTEGAYAATRPTAGRDAEKGTLQLRTYREYSQLP